MPIVALLSPCTWIYCCYLHLQSYTFLAYHQRANQSCINTTAWIKFLGKEVHSSRNLRTLKMRSSDRVLFSLWTFVINQFMCVRCLLPHFRCKDASCRFKLQFCSSVFKPSISFINPWSWLHDMTIGNQVRKQSYKETRICLITNWWAMYLSRVGNQVAYFMHTNTCLLRAVLCFLPCFMGI
jgi:hypothetical protein